MKSDLNLNIISNIVFPDIDFANYSNLFLNVNKKECYKNGSLNEFFEYKFNTWMNIFAVKKYFNYCQIEDLYLNIETNKDCKLLIKGFNCNHIYKNLDEEILSLDIKANEEYDVKIDNAPNWENIYFSLITEEKHFAIKKASFKTSSKPLRDNKMAIITCTFKREKFIKRNIDLFKDFIGKNPELKEKIKLFIIDNGKTLNFNPEFDNIKIYPNKNAGGAGGFTRGIIEAQKEKYTQFLLMDDDVLFFNESFFRTFILSNYLKPEYKNSFINGSMLDLYQKDRFVESVAMRSPSWVRAYIGKRSVLEQNNIANINNTPDSVFNDKNKKISSAWWYCCFSNELVEKNGLPLPLFFRCDDIEFSWRNFGEHHITLNGICVWHEPFDWRVSKAVNFYFSKRNIILTNILHTDSYKKTMLKMLKNDFKSICRSLDYTSCELYLKMMSDILKGKKAFLKDPEELLKEISSYSKDDEWVDAYNKYGIEFAKKNYEKFSADWQEYLKRFRLRKFLYKISFNGKLIPKKFYIKQTSTWSAFPPFEEFLLVLKVYVYNLFTSKVQIRTLNISKEKNLKKRFNYLFKEIKNDYSRIKNEFLKLQKECTTTAFWQEYLGIK